MPARTATPEVTVDHAALLAELGADEVVKHQSDAGRLRIGGKTVSYFAEVKKGLRLRVLTELSSLPASLTKGLETKQGAKGATVLVESKAQAAKAKALLARVAEAKTK